jgi:threonine/homoserine/homoserine lactone efflux protein
MVLGLTLLVLGLLSDLAYAFAAGALSGRLERGATTMRYVSGVVYLGLGMATAFAGSR